MPPSQTLDDPSKPVQPSALWPPSAKQVESGIRTIYDLGKGIVLFGVFVPLMTFTAVWYKLILDCTAGLSFLLYAWYLEGRHESPR